MTSLNLISNPKILTVPKLKFALKNIQSNNGGIEMKSKYNDANVRSPFIHEEKRLVLSHRIAPIWVVGGFLADCSSFIAIISVLG